MLWLNSQYTVTDFTQNTVLWEPGVCGILMSSAMSSAKNMWGCESMSVCPVKELPLKNRQTIKQQQQKLGKRVVPYILTRFNAFPIMLL